MVGVAVGNGVFVGIGVSVATGVGVGAEAVAVKISLAYSSAPTKVRAQITHIQIITTTATIATIRKVERERLPSSGLSSYP
jgi:hypothetical protein